MGVVCDASVRFCPGSGGLTERRRNGPNDENPCEWQPCPPYEPCDDDALNQPGTNSKCGQYGVCRRGFSTLTCRCQDQWSGARCEIYTAPPRPRFGSHERSFLLTSDCVGYMCYSNRCYISKDSGANWDILDSRLTVVLGYFGEYTWFADSEGHAISWNADSEEVLSNADLDVRIQQQMSTNGFVEPIFTFSQKVHEDGQFPPASEQEFIINYGRSLMDPDEACAVHVYLTNSAVVFYNADYMHATSWGTNVHCDNLEVMNEDARCGLITQTQMCENKCLLPNDSYETCNGNGVCVRETGVCLCDWGFSGEKCAESSLM